LHDFLLSTFVVKKTNKCSTYQ